ncbi:MAG: hypothetical protein J5607_09290, partial [Clostridiales bacterium]|nr:hypothetical protein [Clostridiales bacterium]
MDEDLRKQEPEMGSDMDIEKAAQAAENVAAEATQAQETMASAADAAQEPMADAIQETVQEASEEAAQMNEAAQMATTDGTGAGYEPVAVSEPEP